MNAIILAGGKGTRLKPYTTVLPKPLMPIGDYPIIEILIRQLKYYGIRRITIAVGHLGSLIEAYCGNGKKWGVTIQYSYENKPLGTVGPISLVEDFHSTAIILNGDLLTNMDYSKMVEFHQTNSPIVTVGMFNREETISLGVLKTDGNNNILDYVEKPKNQYKVSMGVYVAEPDVLSYVKKDEYFDFPDLIRLLIRKQRKVLGYECEGFWLDIGRMDDYEVALSKYGELKSSLLPFLG